MSRESYQELVEDVRACGARVRAARRSRPDREQG